jgi:O-antigen/teichoic acid export membrane protein
LLIELALPPLWHESALVLLLACLRAPGMILSSLTSAALSAHGRSRTVFLVLLASTPPLFIAMLLGAMKGPALVAGLMTTVALATSVASVRILPGLTHRAVWNLISITARVSLAALAMFGSCYPLIGMSEGLSAIVRIAISANVLLLGVGIYGVLLRLIAPEPYALLRHLAIASAGWVREKLRGQRAAT